MVRQNHNIALGRQRRRDPAELARIATGAMGHQDHGKGAFHMRRALSRRRTMEHPVASHGHGFSARVRRIPDQKVDPVPPKRSRRSAVSDARAPVVGRPGQFDSRPGRTGDDGKKGSEFQVLVHDGFPIGEVYSHGPAVFPFRMRP